MGFKSLTARITLAFATFDVFLNPFIIAAYSSMLGVGRAPGYLAIMAGLVVLKILVCAGFLRRQLRGYEVFASVQDSERTADVILRADEGLQSGSSRFVALYSASWGLTYGLGFCLLQSRLGAGVMFNSGAWITALLMAMGVTFGGFATASPLIAILTASAAGECSMRARQIGVALPRAPESLQSRIVAIALALALGPLTCSFALGFTKQAEGLEQQNKTQAEDLIGRLAEKLGSSAATDDPQKVLSDMSSGQSGVEVSLLDSHGRPLTPNENGEFVAPNYVTEVLQQAKNSVRGLVRHTGKAERIGFQRLSNGRLVVARVDLPANIEGYVVNVFLFILAISMWAPLTAVILGRAITNPVDRLTTTTGRIVEEGKQTEVAYLPVARNDEVGRLSIRFNDLLGMMQDLSRAADAIAGGKLQVTVERKGELPDAFRRMLESLRGMVREIRGTSVDLASAATEILAASQEQESAAASQSSAMEEISRTMESLSASAAHVSDSVQGVLANAEQTLSTTDRMVARITELSSHANRIGELLDVIREIADRSDLLALNGSLEASRAGESGHGFALVAAEMRRLAERVTASVEDVKKLVSDIRDSGSSTVAATEEGRRLADGTTEAARQITFVTQQQRSGTEQVSESIRNITDVVTQAVSATAQTRTSAQGLKAQADRLAALVKRFDVEAGEAT